MSKETQDPVQKPWRLAFAAIRSPRLSDLDRIVLHESSPCAIICCGENEISAQRWNLRLVAMAKVLACSTGELWHLAVARLAGAVVKTSDLTHIWDSCAFKYASSQHSSKTTVVYRNTSSFLLSASLLWSLVTHLYLDIQ